MTNLLYGGQVPTWPSAVVVTEDTPVAGRGRDLSPTPRQSFTQLLGVRQPLNCSLCQSSPSRQVGVIVRVGWSDRFIGRDPIATTNTLSSPAIGEQAIAPARGDQAPPTRGTTRTKASESVGSPAKTSASRKKSAGVIWHLSHCTSGVMDSSKRLTGRTPRARGSGWAPSITLLCR